MTYILGLSAYYHDSAAVLLSDGAIIAAVQEERFTRRRHDASFPEKSVAYCLSAANISLSEVDHIIFYDKPFLKFERLLETHIATSPAGLPAFIKAMPVWLKEKLYLKKLLRDALCQLGDCTSDSLPKLLFSSHHQAHAASAYYASPFDKAVVLCLDGVGEWQTTTAWLAEGNQLDPLWHIDFPHSLGLLYSAFTYYAGFRVNSGEYKLMGLAPYGEPKYVDLILDNLIDLKADGSFRLDMSYFNFATGLTMTNKKFHQLFGAEPRLAESEITQEVMDIARSIQVVTEEVVIRLASTLKKETGANNLCLAGGVALNCVANGRLLKQKIFDNIWVQPAAGDAGGALGAAYLVWFQYLNNKRDLNVPQHDSPKAYMQTAFLGTEYTDEAIEAVLRSKGANYQKRDKEQLIEDTARLLADGHVVGWFQGRMEYGPRALGNRSILGDPRSETMQATLNLKIKKRESFRPFAPAVLKEKQSQWFDMQEDSPFMLFVSQLNKNKCLIEKNSSTDDTNVTGLKRLQKKRSQLPAITHVDYSARLQTVSKHSNKPFYSLLKQFDAITGCPVLINTSFNVRGEPIVESPLDAYRCFMKTDMDTLVIGSFVLDKKNQAEINSDTFEDSFADKATDSTLLSAAELRKFSLSTGIVFSFIFAWLLPWLAESEVNYTVLMVAAVWVVWALLLPMTIKPVYHGWMKFGHVMSRITTPLILSLIYFSLITPMGVVMRIFGKDPLKRKLQTRQKSYREFNDSIRKEQKTKHEEIKQAMEQPF